MLMLRKDVKLGLVLGGVVLGVAGVYLLLSAVGGSKREGVEIATIAPDDTSASTSASLNTVAPSPATVRTGSSSPAASGPIASAAGHAAPSSVSIPTSVSMTSGASSSIGSSIGGQQDDPWAAAFETGRVSTTMTVTENPLNRPTDPAVRQQALDSVAGRSPTASGPASSSASSTSASSAGASSAGASSAGSMPSSASGPSSGSASGTAAGTYTIQVGDTFSSIALDHYGESRHYLLIQQANPGIDPQRLKPGMTIKLPSLPTRSNDATRDDTAGTPAPLDEARQYRVQIGDSLHAISTRLYGDISRWQKIYELNRSQIGDNPARLKVGMILVLPEPPTVR